MHGPDMDDIEAYIGAWSNNVYAWAQGMPALRPNGEFDPTVVPERTALENAFQRLANELGADFRRLLRADQQTGSPLPFITCAFAFRIMASRALNDLLTPIHVIQIRHYISPNSHRTDALDEGRLRVMLSRAWEEAERRFEAARIAYQETRAARQEAERERQAQRARQEAQREARDDGSSENR